MVHWWWVPIVYVLLCMTARCYKSLVWVLPLINLLPVAQLTNMNTNALTYGVVGRTRAAGRYFGSHGHHENAFYI